jgi:hypothetical protein
MDLKSVNVINQTVDFRVNTGQDQVQKHIVEPNNQENHQE